MKNTWQVIVKLVRLSNGEAQQPPSLRKGAFVQIKGIGGLVTAEGFTGPDGIVTFEISESLELRDLKQVFIDGKNTNFYPNLQAGKLIALDPNPTKK